MVVEQEGLNLRPSQMLSPGPAGSGMKEAVTSLHTARGGGQHTLSSKMLKCPTFNKDYYSTINRKSQTSAKYCVKEFLEKFQLLT